MERKFLKQGSKCMLVKTTGGAHDKLSMHNHLVVPSKQSFSCNSFNFLYGATYAPADVMFRPYRLCNCIRRHFIRVVFYCGYLILNDGSLFFNCNFIERRICCHVAKYGAWLFEGSFGCGNGGIDTHFLAF